MADTKVSNAEWDGLYANRTGTQWQPSEDVVRFCARHIQTRVGPDEYITRAGIRHILDFGCGNGRHVIFFAKQGFRVSGLDISRESLDLCRRWLDMESLVADLRQASVEEVPFADDSFDAVVSFGVLDHVRLEVAMRAAGELRRVLKPGGLVHVNLRSPESLDFGKGEEIEPNTFILTEGPEKGIPQHFWSQEEVETFLEGFEVLDWELSVRWLDKARTQRDSRWAVTARLRA